MPHVTFAPRQSTSRGVGSGRHRPMGSSEETTHRDRSPSAGRIELGREPSIKLGALVVEPALRRVVRDDGREEIVEPRVMQVLVALMRAGGGIVSRDDLLASCWRGVVVGEDAITRAMGRLRRLADGIGEGQLRIETVPRVGYRLVRTGSQPVIQSSMPPRRLQPRPNRCWRFWPSRISQATKTSPIFATACRRRSFRPSPAAQR